MSQDEYDPVSSFSDSLMNAFRFWIGRQDTLY